MAEFCRMNPFHLPSLDSCTLIGYRENKLAFMSFERSFAAPNYLELFTGIAGITSILLCQAATMVDSPLP